jgi:hypothetical protein
MFSLNSRPYIAERIASLDLVGQKQQPTQKCRDFYFSELCLLLFRAVDSIQGQTKPVLIRSRAE